MKVVTYLDSEGNYDIGEIFDDNVSDEMQLIKLFPEISLLKKVRYNLVFNEYTFNTPHPVKEGYYLNRVRIYKKLN